MLKKYREYINQVSKMLLELYAIHRILLNKTSVYFLIYKKSGYYMAKMNNLTTYTIKDSRYNYEIIETNKDKSYERIITFERFDGFINKLKALMEK